MLKVHTDACSQVDHQAEPLCAGLMMKPSKLALRASVVHVISQLSFTDAREVADHTQRQYTFERRHLTET
jgi:hypothetical protein